MKNKTCAHCGAFSKLNYIGGKYQRECKGYGVSTGLFDSEDECNAGWNVRVPWWDETWKRDDKAAPPQTNC